MKTIALLGAALIAGAVRYPVEGPITVSDEEADRLVENKLGELVDLEASADGNDDDDGDELDKMTVAKLRELAATEGVDLGTATLKADVVAAIRGHRMCAPKPDELDDKDVDELRTLAGTEGVDLGLFTEKPDIIAAIRKHREPAA